MVEEDLPAGKRVWFHDMRSPDRRMAISCHTSEGLVVISLWRGDTCTSTFRLPLADAARLISVLADGMARGLTRPSMVPDTARRSWLTWVRRVLLRSRPGPRNHLRALP